MKEGHQSITSLLVKYFTEELEPEEQKQLDEWIEAEDKNRQLVDDFNNVHWFSREWNAYKEADERAHWNHVLETIQVLQARENARLVGLRRRRWLSAAAIFFLLAGIGIIGIIHYYSRTELYRDDAERLHSSLEPANSRAILRLGNGLIFNLEEYIGWIMRVGNDDIYKYGEESISFTKGHDSRYAAGSGEEQIFNTITTPKGGWQEVVLPDGSTVRLNAASSVQFAESFGSQRREIELEGEAYFEVKPMAWRIEKGKKPFIVHVRPPAAVLKMYPDSNLLTITASGTSFNIRAYENNPGIRASLLSGTLQVQKSGSAVIDHLGAGQEYVLNRDGSDTIQSLADRPGAVSWKDNEFDFRQQPIDVILQELGRWYNANIFYLEKPADTFSLQGSRTESLSEQLKRLEGTHHIHFNIHRDTIIVSH